MIIGHTEADNRIAILEDMRLGGRRERLATSRAIITKLHIQIARIREVVIQSMKVVIFDMDGVLVDTMPLHYEAMENAVKETTGIELDRRTFYLFEGMPINQMAQKILELKGYDGTKHTENTGLDIIVQKIGTRKKQIFLEMNRVPESFEGVKEIIHDDLECCLKALVTG